MAFNRTFFERAKSIAGAALVVLGMFILYERLGRALNYWKHLLDADPAPGMLSTLILAALRVIQPYSACHQSVLKVLVQQVVVTSWPLLIVMVGTILSRDTFRDNQAGIDAAKEALGRVDPKAGRSTLK